MTDKIRVQVTLEMTGPEYLQFCSELAGHRARDRTDGHRDSGVMILAADQIAAVAVLSGEPHGDPIAGFEGFGALHPKDDS